MSNKATDWFAELDVSNIKFAAYKVLFRLCVHHNQDKPPAVATYPSQAGLMEHAKLSNGGVNKALNELEEAGLISRRKSTKPGTKAPRTYYLLGFDMPLQTPNEPATTNSTDVEPVNEQTPFSEPSNSIKLPVKLHSSGDEHLREHLSETSAAVAACPIELGFEEFWNVHPKRYDKIESFKLYKEAVLEGETIAYLNGAAKLYADQQSGQDYKRIAGSASWLRRRLYQGSLKGEPTNAVGNAGVKEKIKATFAKAFKECNGNLARNCPTDMVAELVAAGSVTEAECRALEIKLPARE